MSNKEVNWDTAPHDASHHGFINNADVVAWYKYDNTMDEWSYRYSTNGILDRDWKVLMPGVQPLAQPLTPRPAPKVIKPEDIEWKVGIDLPPVGLKVRVTYDLKPCDAFSSTVPEGTEVEVIAHSDASGSDEYRSPVAVIRYQVIGSFYAVRQVTPQVIAKVLTKEEKEKIEFDKKVDDVTEAIAGDHPLVNTRLLVERLHKAGLLK